MNVSSVACSDLDIKRLDAEYYGQEFVDNAKKIEAYADVTTLDKIRHDNMPIRRGIDMPKFVDDTSSPLMVTIAAFEDPGLSFKGLKRVEVDQHDEFKGSHIKDGDLLVAMGGYVGKAAICPANMPISNIGRHTARIVVDENKADKYYIWAFIRSQLGEIQFTRYVTGSVQAGINLEDLRDISISLPSSMAQIYIANNVRQAELLREWAKSIDESIISFHKKYIPEQSHLDFDRKTRAVSFTQMTERMDAHFYPGVVDAYLHESPAQFQKLAKICSGLFNGQTQPEAEEDNCDQITVANLSPNYIKGKPRSVETPSKVDRFTKKFDLLMCNAAHNKSYIGRDITFNHSDKKLLPSTEVMVIRCDHSKVPATYLRAYLLTRLGYIQIQSTIRGITAHSYPVDMAKLDIFVPKMMGKEAEEWFATDERLAIAGLASEYATQLTTSAKYLVEALIEGQITEAELIAAQKALEEGDNTKDRAILSNLTDKGYLADGGKPLFPDLDKLYELLEEAQQARDAEQDGDEGAKA